MAIRVVSTELRVVDVRTRIPFRYGIATLTRCPHLLCRVELEVNGRRRHGLSGDNLPPKWFTKVADRSFDDEINEMKRLIAGACARAQEQGPADSAFDLWHRLYSAEMAAAQDAGIPPLLAGFAPSLVERAAIDAFCGDAGITFSEALRSNAFGIDLSRLHPELAGSPADYLEAPLPAIIARHTVGLSDPLTDSDIPPEDRVDDGLPQSLEACIAAYGLTHFKIKLAGQVETDLARLRRVAAILDARCGDRFALTVDGNENFKQLEPFVALWEALQGDDRLSAMLSRLIFVEQPLQRSVALSDETCSALCDWQGRPPIIIDESDAEVGSLPRALAGGYAGTSHKNCKGVFKGIANACLIAHRRALDPSRKLMLSGEDLTNIGPVALQQDLAVMACLGVRHVERNGHHYFRGLSMWPDAVQQAALREHADLYLASPRGFVTPRIEGGKMETRSLLNAPFGVHYDIEAACFAAGGAIT